MSAETLISQLLDLPDQVHRGDFVLNLSEGVTADHAAATLRDYVVTDQLAAAFDNALGFIRAAVEGRNSKAAYLHGSFGAGKSHFMAVLHLLLQHDARARAQEGLAEVCVKHGWVQGKKFLLVPYHMIGAPDMESAILGGYADHVRRRPPRRPLAGHLPGRRPLRQRPPPARTPGRRDVLRRDQPGGRRVEVGQDRRGVDRREVRRRGGGPARRRHARPARGRPGQVPLPGLPGRLGGQDRVVPVARQGPERHQPPRQGAGLRRPDPVPRRADPLARLARRQPRLRPPGGAEAGQARREPDARPAGADRQLRRPPARPPRPGGQERPRRRAAQLRRRPAALGGPVPHDRPGGPQPPRHRREARPAAEGRGVPPGAEAGLRAGDQGPPRGPADAPDPRRRPRDVPHGLPLQPGPGADAGGRLQRAPARADGAEDHAPAPGREARHAQGRRPDPLRRPLGHGGARRGGVLGRDAGPLRERQAALPQQAPAAAGGDERGQRRARPAPRRGPTPSSPAGSSGSTTTTGWSRRCCSRPWCPRSSRSRT